MKRAARLCLGAFASAAIFAAPAAHGDTPAFGSLPVGQMTMPPSGAAPAALGAREKVPGIYSAAQQFHPSTPVMARYVTVVTDEKRAKEIRAGNGFSGEIGSGACMATRDTSGATDPPAWNMQFMRDVNLWPRATNNPQSGVNAVHTEQLVTKDGKTSLEILDAWVDPGSRGARLIGRASMPLTLVGSAIGGVKIYAGRDERAGKPSFVQFVITRPSAASRSGNLLAIHRDGMVVQDNGCGHLRVALAIEGRDGGESAVVAAGIELGSVVVPQDAEKNSKSPQPDLVEMETRTREMQISLSVSKTSRDREPLVSVSFGWAGREEVRRTMEPKPEGSK